MKESRRKFDVSGTFEILKRTMSPLQINNLLVGELWRDIFNDPDLNPELVERYVICQSNCNIDSDNYVSNDLHVFKSLYEFNEALLNVDFPDGADEEWVINIQAAKIDATGKITTMVLEVVEFGKYRYLKDNTNDVSVKSWNSLVGAFYKDNTTIHIHF